MTTTDWTGLTRIGEAARVDNFDDLVERAEVYDPVHFEEPRPMDEEYLTHAFCAEHQLVGRLGEDDDFGVEFAGVEACARRLDEEYPEVR